MSLKKIIIYHIIKPIYSPLLSEYSIIDKCIDIKDKTNICFNGLLLIFIKLLFTKTKKYINTLCYYDNE